MEDNDQTEPIRTVAKLNAELADALDQLKLAEYVRDAGTDPDRAVPAGPVVEYVEIGRQTDDTTVYTIYHTIDGWLVIHEVPVHQVIVGNVETPYGAVGLVRRYHPGTDPVRGATSTVPPSLVEDVSNPLAQQLSDHGLLEHVVEIETQDQEVVLSRPNRRLDVAIRSDDTEWVVHLADNYGFELLGSWESLETAVATVRRHLHVDETQ